jgi:hypothetical protein
VGDVLASNQDKLPSIFACVVEYINLGGLVRQVVEIDLVVFPFGHWLCLKVKAPTPSTTEGRRGYAERNQLMT